ncbi:7,8-dihydropteroate synthase [uncultured Desulfatiglans sp.]|uniref:Dihydropteroate synthase n=1 Tax=Uncultured Desulfatiglans sp. TaxID=1748965 RepID=A0A653AHU6_UNCDX|nr:7,8-dihydropteroate synthase [uncultured Desulfatiglans sp.]
MTTWTLNWPNHTLELGRRTLVMGVLNVTPDSFSDGGRHFAFEEAVAGAWRMVEEGADIIDIGGESTRPFAPELDAATEKARIVPVIEALAKKIPVPISIDTYKAEVAQAALDAGASIINDISALRFDPEMAPLAASRGVPVVLMHMQGTPRNMQENPYYEDLFGEITLFLQDAVERALQAGIREDLIILDPGIGFGKTFTHNLQLIRQLSRFSALGKPILAGPSNKAFIGHILKKTAHERDTGTMAAVTACVLNGAAIVRVHNVRLAAETVAVADAIKRGSIDQNAES